MSARRRAGAQDVPAIVAMLADDAFGRGREQAGSELHPAYARAFEAIAADPNQLLAVAECAGAIVGTLQISFLPGLSHLVAWRGEIEAVRIDSRLRGARPRSPDAALGDRAVPRSRLPAV